MRSRARTRRSPSIPRTGDVDTEFNPRVLVWGASLQYSLPYLKSSVVDLGLPDFVNRLIPLVEVSLQTPVSNFASSGTVTTGTVNPGLIYVGDTYQLALEAMIPVNRDSGTSVGVIGQVHFFLDDIFPNSIGTADFRQQLRIREADVRQQAMNRILKIIAVVSTAAVSGARRWRTPCSTMPAPKSAVRRPRRRAKWCCGSPRIWSRPLATIEVRNESGALVSSGKARLGAKQRAARRAQGARPGTYKVSWRVLSVDTHRTQGDFSFRVGP